MMNPKLEIRYLSDQDDRLAISCIYEESWKTAYQGIVPQAYLDSIPTGKWAAHLDAPNMHHLVLLLQGNIIGTSSFGASRFTDMPGWGEVVSLYLLPLYTRKGYGKLLLQTAVNDLQKLGFADIFLWVLEENGPARRFYEKFGFCQSENRLEQNIGGRDLCEVQYLLQKGSAGVKKCPLV